MFDRPEVGERAILVHIDFTSHDNSEDPDEFRELVTSAGVEPVAVVTGSRKQPSPRLFVGEGKLEEIRDAQRMAKEFVVKQHSNVLLKAESKQ